MDERVRITSSLAVAGAVLLVALIGQAGRWVAPFDIINAVAPLQIGIALAGMLLCIWRRQSGALLFLLAASSGCERIWPEFRPLAAISPTAGPGLRLLSFNSWHGLKDSELAASIILESRADIILLQEAGPLMEAQRERLRTAYPYQSTCPDNRCELAILSRYPMERPRYRFRDGAGRPFGIGLLTARIRLPDGAMVRVATLHMPRPIGAAKEAAFLRQRLIEAVALVGDPRLILGGDFNLVPWSFALQDLDRQLRPMNRVTRSAWSYPAMAGGWKPPPLLPIDHVYVGPLWQLKRTQVLPYAGSDHRPVMVELKPLAPLS